MTNRHHHHHPCPPKPHNNFCHMVKEAINDEIGAVSMYAKMATMVDDIAMKTLIMGIAGDEAGHARTWTAILLTDPECRRC